MKELKYKKWVENGSHIYIYTRVLVKSELDGPALIDLLDVGISPRDSEILQKNGGSSPDTHAAHHNP